MQRMTREKWNMAMVELVRLLEDFELDEALDYVGEMDAYELTDDQADVLDELDEQLELFRYEQAIDLLRKSGM